jgi:hypothetical protein
MPPPCPPRRVYLLSPAHSGGARAALLLRPAASFPLARAVQSADGAPLGDVFTFTSGLYFRGKLAYAEAFARAPRGVAAALVIAPGAGLVPPARRVNEADLRAFAAVPVDPAEPRFRGPLLRDALSLALAAPRAEIVLLGSIASGKYVDVLLEAFDERLLFPAEFVGRGDMSRGGLLLRCVRAGAELACVPVVGAVRRGRRPPRLPPARR